MDSETKSAFPALDGLIVKATGGFYYVSCTGPRAGVYECRARGIFRREGISPLVGDRVKMADVTFSHPAAGEPVCADVSVAARGFAGAGTVAQIYPRSSEFVRPAVANVSRLVIAASVSQPPPDLTNIDRLSAIAVRAGVEPVMVFTKDDMGDASQLVGLYTHAGFRSFAVSSLTGEGLDELRQLLSTGLSAFAGNSGVGKSSLINAICPGAGLGVGSVSRRIGRGRQTTRTVELVAFGGGYIADTPGFSSLDASGHNLIPREELQYAFPDFSPYIGKCRFSGCLHLKGAGCAVLEAVRRGDIAPSRHASYLAMYDEVKDIAGWQIKKAEEENDRRN
jgi:ribosome biogenesis GTPase